MDTQFGGLVMQPSNKTLNIPWALAGKARKHPNWTALPTVSRQLIPQ